MAENKRILVVDDTLFMVRTLSMTLERGGYEVVSAQDGEEALAVLREHRPALVFLDVEMPKKNGYEVCEAVRRDPDLAATHIIMLTSKGQDADERRALQAGADEYMTKPFSPSRVLERAREILG